MPELGVLDAKLYENIFSVYLKDNHYVYNIIKKVVVPHDTIDAQYFTYEVITADTPWTAISHKHYGTIKLWWLICILNNITNPVYNIPPGTVVKILKSEYVSAIINIIGKGIK